MTFICKKTSSNTWQKLQSKGVLWIIAVGSTIKPIRMSIYIKLSSKVSHQGLKLENVRNWNFQTKIRSDCLMRVPEGIFVLPHGIDRRMIIS